MIGWIGFALAGGPAEVTPTPAELTALAQGEVVVRPAPDSTGEMVGLVDLPGASTEAAWGAIFDWDMRVQTVGAIRGVTVYAEETDPGGLGVTFQLSVLGTDVTYHLRYTIDRDEGWTSFTLDPDREHDIVQTHGSYRISDIDGGVRITYRSRTDTGRAVPGFLRRWVATSSIRDQLAEMRRRAVGG